VGSISLSIAVRKGRPLGCAYDKDIGERQCDNGEIGWEAVLWGKKREREAKTREGQKQIKSGIVDDDTAETPCGRCGRRWHAWRWHALTAEEADEGLFVGCTLSFGCTVHQEADFC
jgi:hypothetical protein